MLFRMCLRLWHHWWHLWPQWQILLQAGRFNTLALLGTFVLVSPFGKCYVRSYVSERVVKKHKPSSALILKRLNPDLSELYLLARVYAKKPCCGGMCLKMLWKGTRHPLTDVELSSPSYCHSGFGVSVLEAIMAAISWNYHTSSYKSNVELKALLQRDVGLSKMSYKVYHRGGLGNTPTVPKGIEVRTILTCVYTLSNTKPFIR